MKKTPDWPQKLNETLHETSRFETEIYWGNVVNDSMVSYNITVLRPAQNIDEIYTLDCLAGCESEAHAADWIRSFLNSLIRSKNHYKHFDTMTALCCKMAADSVSISVSFLATSTQCWRFHVFLLIVSSSFAFMTKKCRRTLRIQSAPQRNARSCATHNSANSRLRYNSQANYPISVNQNVVIGTVYYRTVLEAEELFSIDRPA